jgi:hypothetical protein
VVPVVQVGVDGPVAARVLDPEVADGITAAGRPGPDVIQVEGFTEADSSSTAHTGQRTQNSELLGEQGPDSSQREAVNVHWFPFTDHRVSFASLIGSADRWFCQRD